MLKDYFVLPWKEIKRRKLRAWLTLIGVFIGIAAIISLITLGQGLENAIEKQFEALGKDKLFITAKGGTISGMGSSVKLTEKDVEAVSDVSGIKRAAGMAYSIGKIEYNDKVWFPYVMGLPSDPDDMALVGEAQTWKILNGRNIKKGDKYKAVLGYEYTLDNLFEKPVELGDRILLENQELKVVGFLEKIGSPPDDQGILIPLDAYSEIYDSGDEVHFVIAQTDTGEDPTKIAGLVEKDLRKSRHVKEGEEDFVIQTPEQFAESFAAILNMVQIVLIGIAGISLLVGGIGIMNTMYTAVLQRTKQIGVMKALGARNRQILFLFLVESGLYGLGGGLIGIAIGIGFAKMVEAVFIYVVGPAFLSVEIDWLLVIGTLIFSFLVGCLSGLAPARSASKQKPVDSLRYE